MNRIWQFLLDPRVIGIIGIAGLAGFLFFGANVMQITAIYAGIALGVFLLIWAILWLVRRFLVYRKAAALEKALEGKNEEAIDEAPRSHRPEQQALRTRMQQAVKTIKTSKLGQTSGRAALYELPWYMIIGNPAAGKSTAIVKSGLNFPFSDNQGNIIQGIGGTRHCDWFFTTEGILLDTAGRYSVHKEDHDEWLSFLDLLKKHRPKAPINGVIIAISIAELLKNNAENNTQLAKNLRQRVQELSEQLAIFAPVYVVFTKMDLVSGFTEFFKDSEPTERNQVWGATLPYSPQIRSDAIELFEKHFELLREGLKERFLALMSLHRGRMLEPKVLTYPLEFATIKPILKNFIAILFEENPYQFQPVFRGFYFTSATQEGIVSSLASDQVAQQFNLSTAEQGVKQITSAATHGYFLKDLFSKVIFADKNLVKQYVSKRKTRLRLATFSTAALLLAGALAGWGTAYLGNRQLMKTVKTDLDKAVALQQDRTDLASRMEAMEVLQKRIEQLRAWKKDRPLSVSLGLYQGDEMERKLLREYFNGANQLMLAPVGQALETYLAQVNRNADKLRPMVKVPQSGAASINTAASATTPVGTTRFASAAPDSVEDAYNGLKTYLMLGQPEHREAGHLLDQITRFWRGWLENNRGTAAHAQIIQNGERIITFTLSNLTDPDFPTLNNNFALVDQTRENLRHVVRGMPVRERVYADIKARAATRYAPITVNRFTGDVDRNIIGGSYVVSGVFTKEAWQEYIYKAFKDAANVELQSTDWVLKTSSKDDLSLEGSPEQIRQTLTQMYKTEYVAEWKKFMQGISINDFSDFNMAVAHINRLSDINGSPLYKLLNLLYEQTSWDNPSILNERLKQTQTGFMAWFKQSILRQAPSRVDINLNVTSPQAGLAMGPIGREFEGLVKIMDTRDSSAVPIKGYLDVLGKIRSRLNQIKNQGDSGPAIKTLVSATLDGNGSELADALRYVDEQLMLGQTEAMRTTLRPLLVRPLMQSFGVLIKPTEIEINRVWAAQVHGPFQSMLASKYPFDQGSRVEATEAEISKVFGGTGSIAKFSTETLGPLVTRRGDTIITKTWADKGIALRPAFTTGLATWVNYGSNSGSTPSVQAANNQTVFQVLPNPSPDITEYTLEIDGQVLRYRNTAAAWTNFFWPNPTASPGVKLSAINTAGKLIEIVNEPGRYGLDRLFETAAIKKLEGGISALSWAKEGVSVSVKLRVISRPGANTNNVTQSSSASQGLRGLHLPALVAGNDDKPAADTSPATLAQPTAIQPATNLSNTTRP